jgi:hypothetical protein
MKQLIVYSLILVLIIRSSLVNCSSLASNNENPTVVVVKRRVNQYFSGNSADSGDFGSSSFTPKLIQKWITTGLAFFKRNRCLKSGLGSSETECEMFNERLSNQSEIGVYLGYDRLINVENDAKFATRRKVYGILPDSNTKRDGGDLHEAVLVLDPNPNANFGHTLGMFYVDLGIDAKDCHGDEVIHYPGKLIN